MTVNALITDGLLFTPSLMVTEGMDIGPPSNPSTGPVTTSAAYLAEHRRPNRTPIYQVKLRAIGIQPTGYWKMEQAGGTRLDTQGRNDMQATGAPGNTAGKVGNALGLVRAASQYLSAPVTDGVLQTGDITFGIIATVKMDTKPATMVIASQYSTATNRSWLLYYESGADRFDFTINDGNGTQVRIKADALGSPVIGTSYTIMGWRDKAAQTINIWANGFLNSVSTAVIPSIAGTDFRIGAYAASGVAGDFWNGYIDEVLWFKNKFLTPAQQSTYYNNGALVSFEDYDLAQALFTFCSSSSVYSEDLGDEVLVPIELSKRVEVENFRAPLAVFQFDLVDIGEVVTAAVAAGLEGARCDLYSGFYDLEWGATPRNYAQRFSGIITDFTYTAGRYRVTARSRFAAAQDKIIFAGASTKLTAAIGATDTTFAVEDASAFEPAADLPQPSRKLVLTDQEISVYRSKTNTQLGSVIRTSIYGYSVPPAAGPATSHTAGTTARELIKTGSLVPENSGAAIDDLHPIEIMKDVFTGFGKYGIGESQILLNISEWDIAKAALGANLQFMHILADGISAKKFLEDMCRDLAGYLTENEAGQIGFKLFQSAGSATFIDTVEDAQLTNFPRWLRNAEKGYNKVLYHYNHMPTNGQYMAAYEYRDDTLIAALGREVTLEIFSKGIRSYWLNQNPAAPTLNWFGATAAFLPARSAAHVNRFSSVNGAPVISAECSLDHNLLQPGNDVRLSFSQVINLAAAERSITDQPAEIIAVRERFQEATLDMEFLLYPGYVDPYAPEALRALVDTDYVAPTGSTIVVGDGGDFQAAINSAVAGDVITLNAGSTYTGNFTLPNKAGSGYIHIRSSAALTSEGTRITTAQAAAFPKIVTANATAAIQADATAHHYRFINVEVTSGATAVTSGLIKLGTGSETLTSQFPHHIIFDRSYIHGHATSGGRRGILLAGNDLGLVDSYISDWKLSGTESQAICGWTGEGPWKVVNCYVEGSAQGMLVGGADPSIANLIPSDIEVRNNLFSKPRKWNPFDANYDSSTWLIKNAFELKNARRVLIDGNTFQYNWVSGQTGKIILFTVINQDGGATWSAVEDVTFTNNIISGSLSGMSLSSSDGGFANAGGRRILIEDNFFFDIGGAEWGEGQSPDFLASVIFSCTNGIDDVTINHNTVIHALDFPSDGLFISADGAPYVRFKLTNNVFEHNEYGIKGTGLASGNATLAVYFPGAVVSRNVIIGGNSAVYPANNYFPADLAAVGFEEIGLTSGLVSCLELEEASGTRADRMRANNMADNNTVTQAVGKVGNAGQFTRANTEYLSKASPTFPTGANQSASVLAWMYLDSIGIAQGIVTVDDNSTNRAWDGPFIEGAGNNVQCYVGGNGTALTSISATTFGALSAGQWYLAACRYDAAADLIKVSVNALPADTVAHTTGIFAGTAPLRVGAGPSTSNPANGRIDQVLIYNRSLLDAEVTWLYNSTSGRSFYRLNDYRLGGASAYIAAATDSLPIGAANAVILLL